MFKVIFVIIGTLIGAGFASGREIYIFFSNYGQKGIFGIILTSILTSVIIYRVLIIEKTYEITNYNKLLEIINWKNFRINKILNKIIDLFLLVSFYIMVAGFSSYMKQKFNIPLYLSSSIFTSICYLVFKKNIDGLIKVNEFLVPILILFILYFGVKNIPYIIQTKPEIITFKKHGWIISSVLYASYNSIILVPVLTGLRDYLKNKKDIIKISVISGFIILCLATLIFLMLLRDTYFLSQIDMPLLYITEEYGTAFEVLYGFIIIASIFTSAISTGYSFLKNTSDGKKYNKMLIFLCVSAVAVSKIGFSNLVETLYPLFGILGILQIILLFKK